VKDPEEAFKVMVYEFFGPDVPEVFSLDDLRNAFRSGFDTGKMTAWPG
jgi:hypothetical protein